ncbi:MazG-like family protein, partial [Actinomadura sp. NPDC048032]
VFSYLLQLADVLDVDLSRAVAQKIQQNEVRYPIAKTSGNAKKYTELE